jgi:hypothetical protein
MGVFNYNGQENTLDTGTPVKADGNQIATAGWVKDRIKENSPTGNCATGQTSSTSNSTGNTSATSNTNTSTGTSTSNADTGTS